MELLNILRVLVRRRSLVALGAAVATFSGLMVGGALGLGPFDASVKRSWTATAVAQIDMPRPLAVDAHASAATIQTQTVLLADYLTSDASRDAIGRHAGIPPARISVTPSTDAPVRRSPLVTRAAESAMVPITPYTVRASTWTKSPMITLVAAGPEERTTMRLSRAAMDVLIENPTTRAPAAAVHRVTVKQLGAARVESEVTGGASLPLGVAAGLFVFLAWCGGIIVGAGVLRVWRRTLPRTAATAN